MTDFTMNDGRTIPAVTPPPVTRLRSNTTRPATGSTPKNASCSREAQWLVAR